MKKIDQEILNCLQGIKGSGLFVSNHAANFVFPNLEIDGFGELAYPVNEWQAKGLIGIAKKAPFGKGHETIVDEKVRSAWEIDAAPLHFGGDTWVKFLDQIILKIKKDLGIKNDDIEARLYKLLIYEKGDFFLKHKDSEKEKGMFGTMIVGLPSKHTGGTLEVEFDKEKKFVQFDKDCTEGRIPYAAFYADCDHEIKPLESGYRVVLVYNLIQKSQGTLIAPESLEQHATKLSSLLLKDREECFDEPKIILLGHQYTPENFSLEQLKLNDRAKAKVLFGAAKTAGYYANLCLITSFVTGTPLDYDDDSEEIDEVLEEYVEMAKWTDTPNPGLGKLQIGEDELLATFKLNEEEPLVKENSGYMGNYGPDVSHWYHYGAVVMWPKEKHGQLLAPQKMEIQLKWLEYYNQERSNLDENEKEICRQILSRLETNESMDEGRKYNVIADWFITDRNKQSFESVGFNLLNKYFEHIDAAYWIELLEVYKKESVDLFIEFIAKEMDKPKLEKLISIFDAHKNSTDFKVIITKQISKLPEYLSFIISHSSRKGKLISASILDKLLDLEMDFPQSMDWITYVSNLLLTYKERKYINDLIGIFLNRPNLSLLGVKLLQICKTELASRVENKPQPFTDWSRETPNGGLYKQQWEIIKAFMQSPIDRALDYRANQVDRNAMETAIQKADVDLAVETIKKGSPYTLRITKTMQSYHRKMKLWEEDEALLKQIMDRGKE